MTSTEDHRSMDVLACICCEITTLQLYKKYNKWKKNIVNEIKTKASDECFLDYDND